MRVYIILLILMISTNSMAQNGFSGVYPLTSGNMWVYTESFYSGLMNNSGKNFNSIYTDTTFTGSPFFVLDTTHIIDSIEYFTIRIPFYDSSLYYYERIRKDGYIVVYEGDSYPGLNHEMIVYKKNAKIGDYWVNWGPEVGHDSIYIFVTDTAQRVVLNQIVTVKTMHITDSLLIDYYQYWTEKFGLVHETYEGSNYYIKGAYIDRVAYGDTTWFITSVKNNVKPVNNFQLYQNYPNPFNPTTVIKYQIPSDNFVSLKVYNTLGQMVANLVNANKQAGTYEVNFDGSKLSSGVYFYILRVGQNGSEYIKAAKMLLLK